MVCAGTKLTGSRIGLCGVQTGRRRRCQPLLPGRYYQTDLPGRYYQADLPRRPHAEKQTLAGLTGCHMNEIDAVPGALRFSGVTSPGDTSKPWWEQLFKAGSAAPKTTGQVTATEKRALEAAFKATS